LYPHKITWQNNVPVPDKAEPERVVVTPDEPLLLECQHFLECVQNGSKPKTDGNEGLRVLRVLNASQRSIYQNGGKIDLKTLDTKSKQLTIQQENFIHPTAVIDDGITIGAGTKIWHFSHLLKGSKIGMQCNIGQNVVIGPDVKIGNQCKIQNNVSVYKGVTLEDGVFCGPSMVFTNIYNPRAEIRKMDQVRPTLVKKGATIGANSTIICGVTLGRYCFIGAGAVVNKNVLDNALVVGNPAKQIGWACDCGERLPDDLECFSCGKKYEKSENGIQLMSS
jgi:UDP-2-acetamido-3-amino-2,3-dideoxy-glucuronate N-acetyltransferase